MKLKNKKILVTGASGFIGSHLTENLLEKDLEVRVLLREDLGTLKNVKGVKKAEIAKGDLLDYEAVRNAVKGVDIIFHLGGESLSKISGKDETNRYRVNVNGTENILKAGKENNCERIIFVSSALLYAKNHENQKSINEESELDLISPYTSSKREAEKLCIEYSQEYNLPVSIVRLFNTYGERQSQKAVIPKIICEALTGKEIFLHPLKRIDFIYVGDVVDALIRVAEEESCIGEILNIGSGKGILLFELGKTLEKIVGKPLNIKPFPLNEEDKKEYKIENFVCDNSKISELTGWSPKMQLEEGMRKVFEYIKNNKNEYNLE